MLPLWNYFLQSLLYFVVVRSNRNEGLVRIIMPVKSTTSIGLGRFGLVFSILRRQKEDTGMLAVVRYAHVLSPFLLSICLYDHPYE